MRYWLLFCLLFPLAVIGQNNNDIRLDSLRGDGMLLDKGWKFGQGDNPDFANPDFDDKNWVDVNLDVPVNELSGTPLKKMGWYRLRFKLDPSCKDTLGALLVDQYGASEVYLDGRLIKQFGKIVSDEDFIIFNPHGQPVPIIFSRASSHLIAVRLGYAIPSSLLIRKQIDIVPFSLRLQLLTKALATGENIIKLSRGDTGVAFVNAEFCLLFLLLFLFYPRRPLNLFFSLFNLFLFLQFLIGHFLQEGQYSLTTFFVLTKTSDLISRATGIAILLFILTALFNKVKPIFRWFIALLLLVDFPMSIFFPKTFLLSQSLHLVFTLMALWFALSAFRSEKRENWLIGVLALSVFFVNLNVLIFFFAKYKLPGIEMIAGIAIALSMLIYLALNFARTNNSLEQQLVQIKNLSDDNIRREQEKQQLLASQNEMLEKQVTQRTAELTTSLIELKSTQAQLIQSEKMASLGELTAGIAHEIQNPLNFVNNFSDVNKDLLGEMKDEIDKGNTEEAKTIANDIIANEEKINHHGKRAGDIVKGMLQHSRSSSGVMEPTDINALADEYLRLSFHGLRAKDKNFKADFKTDFDNSIGKINIIPQDIGRVLLNFFNNAFYAVNEQKSKNLISYEPKVSVTTKKSENSVIITVSDNGNGIPQKIVDKIFQPFFTTKPTGQGTGLGLSLSYDIVKAHGGEIKVETVEGAGTTFIIQLPIN